MTYQGKIKRITISSGLILSFLLAHTGTAQNSLCDQLLNYLQSSQISCHDSQPDSRFNGLWWSEIENRRTTVFFGSANKRAYDANCFITARIHNLLAELYLQDTSLQMIPLILNSSLPAINNFKNGQGYNFFPKMEVPIRLVARGETGYYPDGMRRASHFDYKNILINHGFNIYEDADDTALGYYSNFLGRKIKAVTEHCLEFSVESLADYLSQYRDTKRRVINFWNWISHQGRQTSAYLTWLPDDSNRVNYKLIPRKGEKYIPYGVNDVDCVLNANVLGALSAMGVQPDSSMQEAADWILRAVAQSQCEKCAVYYPTGNTLAYAVVKAWTRGAKMLEPALPALKEQLVQSQNPDGSWSDRIKGNEIQATLHALNSLLGMRSLLEKDIDPYIFLAKQFLVSKLQYKNNQAWLPGGVAFSAGSVFTRTHVWISDAYSTALLLEAVCLISNSGRSDDLTR